MSKVEQYKVWSKEEKKYLPPYRIKVDPHGNIEYTKPMRSKWNKGNPEVHTLAYYTGFKDKLQQPIYSTDLVKYEFGGIIEVSEVIYKHDRFNLLIDGQLISLEVMCKFCKIVGINYKLKTT